MTHLRGDEIQLAPATPRRGWRMIDFSSPRHRAKFGYLLMAPAVILMALIIVFPILLSVDISLQDVRMARVGGEREPWTLQNYRWLVTSPEFRNAAWVTARMVLMVGGTCLVIGLATAMLVNQRFKGRSLARLFVALPWAVPEVVATVIWAWMLDSSFGVVNYALLRTGLVDQPVQFASNATAAFFAVCFVMIWKGYPLVSIMLLAGLQSIPEEQYQAAKVDGASPWQEFIHITLPGLLPVIGVLFILTSKMLPATLLVIPLFAIFRSTGLVGTLWSVILAQATLIVPFCTWMLKGYFDTIPNELEHAALVDGCSPLGTIFRIVLPVAAPGLAATALYAFVLSWSDFLFARTFLTTSQSNWTLNMGIATLKGEYITDWNVIMAAALMAAAPIVVVYLFLERFLVSGLASGSEK